MTNQPDTARDDDRDDRPASTPADRFLATMSHEIRTPLNGVIGILELMEREALPDTAADMRTVAHRSAKALQALLTDILHFARNTTDELKIAYTPEDVDAIMHDVARLYAANAAGSAISVTVDDSAALPHRVITDGERLRQVLTNLVSNAIKHADCSRITLSASARKCDDADDFTHELTVRVTDDGVGVPDAFLGELFAPFAQAHAHNSGTGLGLTISRAIAERLHGRLDHEAPIGGGAAFFMVLPINVAAATPDQSVIETGAPLTRETHAQHHEPPAAAVTIHYAEHFGSSADNSLHVATPAELAAAIADNPGCKVRIAPNAPAPERIERLLDVLTSAGVMERSQVDPSSTKPEHAGNAPPIDHSRLRLLSTELGSAAHVVNIVDFYMQQLEARMTAIEAASGSNELAAAAHALKSASLTVGAVALAHAAGRIEHAARDGSARAGDGHLNALVQAAQATRQHWDDRDDGLKAA